MPILKLWDPLLTLLSSPYPEIVAHTCWVIGTAIQNNIKAQAAVSQCSKKSVPSANELKSFIYMKRSLASWISFTRRLPSLHILHRYVLKLHTLFRLPSNTGLWLLMLFALQPLLRKAATQFSDEV